MCVKNPVVCAACKIGWFYGPPACHPSKNETLTQSWVMLGRYLQRWPNIGPDPAIDLFFVLAAIWKGKTFHLPQQVTDWATRRTLRQNCLRVFQLTQCRSIVCGAGPALSQRLANVSAWICRDTKCLDWETAGLCGLRISPPPPPRPAPRWFTSAFCRSIYLSRGGRTGQPRARHPPHGPAFPGGISGKIPLTYRWHPPCCFRVPIIRCLVPPLQRGDGL